MKVGTKDLFMYVCNCNAITERDLAAAIKDGASHWRDVHAHFKHTPCCGMCENEITETINSEKFNVCQGTENMSPLQQPTSSSRVSKAA